MFCANSVKTFLHRRIRTDVGEDGHFLMPMGDHLEFAKQISGSEYPVETEGPFGKVIEWAAVPGRPDNHLFDCLVGSVVAASISGRIKFGEASTIIAPKSKRVSYL